MRILIKNKLSNHKYKTPEGYLVCVDSPIARTGPQEYRFKDVYPDSDDETMIIIDRKPEDVLSDETLASFENKPLTNEHPMENINPDNFKNYVVGFARDIHEGTFEEQPVVLGTLIFTDAEAISDIENGRKTELSCGYDCDIIKENGVLCQKNIRGNHIALCEAGRAGIAKILDSEVIDKPDLETNSGKQDYYFQQLMAALSILKPRDWNRVGTKVNLNGNNITFTASPQGITIYNSKNGNKQLVTSENEVKSYIKQHYINDELIQSGSKEALQKNIKTEIESGKDPKQAAAIAYATKRKNDVDTREESTKKLKEELQTYKEDSMKKYYITYKDLYLNQLFKDVEVKANSINEALKKIVRFGTYDIMIIKVQTDTEYYPKVFGRLSELQKQNFEDEKPEEIEVRDNEVIEDEEVKVKDSKFYVGISRYDYTKSQAEADARKYGLRLQILGKSKDPHYEYDAYLIGPKDKIQKLLKANDMEELEEYIEDSCIEDETIEYQGFKIEKNADTNAYGDVIITFDGKKRYFTNVKEAKEFIDLHVNDSTIKDGSLAHSKTNIAEKAMNIINKIKILNKKTNDSTIKDDSLSHSKLKVGQKKIKIR